MKDAALALVAAAAVVLFVRDCSGRRALEARNAQLDSLRTEVLEEQLRADGWETRLVEGTGDLRARIRELVDDSTSTAARMADLADQVETLGGRVGVLAEMYGTAVGQIEAQGTVHVSDSGPEISDTRPDSISAEIDDGLLSGRLVYRPPALLAIDPYRVSLELVLGVSEAPDGRALLTAQPTHPNASVRYGDVYYQPPAPVEFCSVWTKATWFAGGAAAGGGLALAKEIVLNLIGG